ncbi:MAG: hypothetical protein KGV56_00500 [Gammaproteobacteria bacterium]|nr:hypothetical protein [Gammaproteobacteria bacterium]
MARLTAEQKALAKIDYEVNGLSQNAIAKKYGVGKATISRLAKEQDWQAGKVEHLVSEKKNAIKALNKVEHQMEHLNEAFQIAIDKRVYKELNEEGIFIQSAIENQYLANQKIGQLLTAKKLEMSDIEAHSRVTERNNKVVNNKQDVQTAIQINNEGKDKQVTPTINLTFNQ